MSGLLSFLLFAALFFFMMRFGCGSHVGHGGHAGHDGGTGSPDPGRGGGSGATPTTNVDPVCGMRVDADMGYTKMYRGKAYRFCSRDCLDKFEADPDKFAGGASQVPAQPGMGHGSHP